jgi:tetratricopeptide (TPR) repeat protein
LKRQLRLDPEYVKAWYNKGCVLANLGEKEKAIECFDKVMALDPDDIYAVYAKLVTLKELGKYDEEEQTFEILSQRLAAQHLLMVIPETSVLIEKLSNTDPLMKISAAMLCKLLEIQRPSRL